MTDKQKDGGSAYPARWRADGDGMSLRDYFAAAAMQGMIASTDTQPDGGERENIDWKMRERWLSRLVRDCYKIADAMLKEREEGDAN